MSLSPFFSSSFFLSLDESSLTLCFYVLSRLAAAAGCCRWSPAGNEAPRMQPDGSDGKSTTRDIRETGDTETKTSSQIRTLLLGAVLPRFRSWPESLAYLCMHASRASTAFTCWEIATGLFASRIHDDRTSGNELIRCLVSVIPAQYYKWAKWTSIRDAFLFEWKFEPVMYAFLFSFFDDISQRYKLCMDEIKFLFFRETILKL